MKVKKLLTLFAAAMMLLGVQNANAIVYTVLDGSNLGAGEGPAKLFDGTTNTKWGTHDDDPYVVFKTSVPIKPTAYELVIANDTHSNTGRNWKNWKIYAGNFASEADATRNASGWVKIDLKEDQSLPTGQFATQSLSLSETVGDFYSYFRIEIEALSGSWDDYCQMDGFSFTSPALPVGTVDFTCTATQGNNSNSAEGMEKLFDGVYTTKYCGNASNADGAKQVYAIVEASSAVYVWGYDMTTANDNEQYGRCVTGWTLYGSNDASAKTDASHSSWVAISNLGSNNLVQQKNNYTQRFFCDKDKVNTAYKYFKLTLDDGGFVQLTEFKLCYETCPVVSYNWENGYLSDTGRNSETETKNAVDGKLNEKMQGNNLASSWVIIKTADNNPYTVKSYSFSTHDDGDWNNRAPKTWIIEGSNDKSSWTTIDEVTSGDPIDNLNYKTFEFKPSNVDGAFKYIKLTLNSMKGTGWTQVGEFHVTNGCASHTWVDLDYVAPTCVSDGGGEKQCSVCGVTKLTGVEPATGNHTYDANGFCTVCNQPNPNFMTKNGDFYEPTTVVQFNWLKAMIQSGATVNIRLTQDVDLSGFAGFGNGEEVNDHLVPFSGEFDGGGHWIKNLHIDVVKKNTGLFGLTNGANFHDLGFFNAYVKVNGTQNVGIIVGNAKNTIFNRVAVMNGSKVEGFDHVGAFVGNTEGTCVISNCITDAEVYSTTYQAGGFVGTSSGLTLEKSLFLGSVGCGNSAGDVGGFISRIETDNSTKVQNNIMAATMLTTAKSDITTPLVAQHTNSTYGNNYVAASTIFKSTDSNAADDLKAGKTMEFDNLNGYQGKTTDDAEMKVASFYTSPMGWDMTNDWTFHAEGYYPVLKWMVANISNADELMAFASNVNSGMTDLVAQLTGAINMSGVAYTPIGTEANKYAGSFDGKGNVVSNISYTSSTQDHVGLFGYVENATIQNTVLDGATITVTTKQNTGGLVGTASASTIQKCAVVNSTITGHDHVAAIVANAIDGTEVRNNYSNATIVSDQYQAGGLVGTIKVATIEKNLFVGTVSNPSGDASGLISRIDAAVSPNPEVRNNMVAAPTITGSSTYAIIKADWNDRPVTFADNYTLKSTVYSTGEKILNQKDDSNGKQISWIDATTKDFYETTLGWDFTNDWKFTCGGKYPILKIMADEALPTQDVTVTSAGYATMVANYDYDFTSAPVETYAVTASASPGYVHLEPVTSAKHGEALLLKGSADTYTLTATATAQTTTAENLLKAAEEDIVSNGTMYALAKIDNVVGFYQVGTAESAVTIPAGKAYLEGVGGSVKAYIFDFDDDPDAISSLLASPEEEGQVYNLAGQRIQKMQKGINIVNGKKVLR